MGGVFKFDSKLGVIVSTKYLLPCSCGKSVPVETSQAGQEVVCECGLTLTVPSMLKIKKLQQADEIPKKGTKGSTAAATETKSSRMVNWNIFSVGLILTLFTGWICWSIIANSYPRPEDVLYKRVMYTFGSKVLYNDTTPIPIEESSFFSISGEQIDRFYPMEALEYWDLVKDGPAMSMNFRENYQSLIDSYYIRCGASIIVVALSFGMVIASFFLGKRKVIADRSGSVWK